MVNPFSKHSAGPSFSEGKQAAQELRARHTQDAASPSKQDSKEFEEFSKGQSIEGDAHIKEECVEYTLSEVEMETMNDICKSFKALERNSTEPSLCEGRSRPVEQEVLRARVSEALISLMRAILNTAESLESLAPVLINQAMMGTQATSSDSKLGMKSKSNAENGKVIEKAKLSDGHDRWYCGATSTTIFHTKRDVIQKTRQTDGIQATDLGGTEKWLLTSADNCMMVLSVPRRDVNM